MCDAADLLRPLADTLQQAAGVELKITVRIKGSEQQQVGKAGRLHAVRQGMQKGSSQTPAWLLGV